MAFIDIHTNNLSRQLRNASTYLDNWVYVPGTAITGDWKKPYAFRSLDEFQKTCGTSSPDGSITYEYVAGLLSAGLPVLFRRIAYVNQNNLTDEDIVKAEAAIAAGDDATEDQIEAASRVNGVKRAKIQLTHTVQEEGEPTQVTDLIITEKYGGSYGNDLKVTIRKNGETSYVIEIYYKNSLVESNRFVTVPTDMQEQLEINQLFINALSKLNMEKVDINVVETDPAKFKLSLVTDERLLGGADIDEGLVGAEIPASLDYIYDKILYQPKFITSGGYTDENMDEGQSGTGGTTPIATAMLQISRTRQDCRALIDLPIGTPMERYKSLATMVSYQQTSSQQAIPSASMYGPWQYMQVGSEQLWMPPSYVFLTVVGSDISKGGRAYTPKAGKLSGIVTNIIKPEFDIGSTIAEDWQSDTETNINPIMRLQSGSYVINGNSTLLQPDTTSEEINAFQESSADLTIIEIRRFIYNLATELQYQYNSAEAFENFSLRTAKFFETMISENAMSSYDITNISTDDEPRKLKVQVDVYITPTIKKIEIFLNVAYGSVEVITGGAE